MSNTGQIKRYEVGEVYGSPGVVEDNDGEFVTYDDHVRIVSELRRCIADQLKLIKVAGDRISILEGDVKYMTQECEKAIQECEKANYRKYDDYSTLRQLDELVNYRHIILTAKD